MLLVIKGGFLQTIRNEKNVNVANFCFSYAIRNEAEQWIL